VSNKRPVVSKRSSGWLYLVTELSIPAVVKRAPVMHLGCMRSPTCYISTHADTYTYPSIMLQSSIVTLSLHI
jgi:hypothetical protein